MLKQPIPRRWKIILTAASVVALLLGYTFLSWLQHRRNPRDTTIPTWRQMAGGVGKVLRSRGQDDRWVVADSKATVFRLFLGLLVGVLGAIVLGLLMGCHEGMEHFFVPPLSLLAKVPPTAALAVFFVMFGTGRDMYVAMIAFGILPTLAQAVYLAVRDVPDELLFKAYTLGASNGEIVCSVIFPHTLPKIIDAVRLQIGPAMVYLIAAEMVCAGEGFGYRIRLEFKKANMDLVYPYLVLLACFGFGMDRGLRRLQRAVCPWYSG